MFPNSVNFRELFCNPGAYLGMRPVDNYENFQQRFSQVESDSEEMQGSQGSHQGSQNNSNSPRKFYSRYGKGLTRCGSDGNLRNQQVTSTKVTSSQLPQNNPSVIARSKDERDILSGLLNTIRDSTGEVLVSVAVVRDTLQQQGRNSESQLLENFQKIHDTVKSCNDEMVKALEVNENQRKEQLSMKQDLLKSIADLQSELKASQAENSNRSFEKLSAVCEAGHKQTQDRLTELYHMHKKDLQIFLEEQQRKQVSDMASCQEHFKDLMKIHEDRIKDSSSQFGKQIQIVNQQSKTMNEKLGKDLKKSFENVQKILKQDVEKFGKQVKSIKSADVEQKAHHNAICHLLEKYKIEMSSKVSQQLETLLREHGNNLKCMVKDAVDQEISCSEKACQQMKDTIQDRMEAGMCALKNSHEEQMQRIMEKLVRAAPPLTPKMSIPIIPPPTLEQFQQQTSLASANTSRNNRNMSNDIQDTQQAQFCQYSSSNHATHIHKSGVADITLNNNNTESVNRTENLRHHHINHVSPALPSQCQAMWAGCTFTSKYTNTMYPSPVATVLPQLQANNRMLAITSHQNKPEKENIPQVTARQGNEIGNKANLAHPEKSQFDDLHVHTAPHIKKTKAYKRPARKRRKKNGKTKAKKTKTVVNDEPLTEDVDDTFDWMESDECHLENCNQSTTASSRILEDRKQYPFANPPGQTVSNTSNIFDEPMHSADFHPGTLPQKSVYEFTDDESDDPCTLSRSRMNQQEKVWSSYNLGRPNSAQQNQADLRWNAVCGAPLRTYNSMPGQPSKMLTMTNNHQETQKPDSFEDKKEQCYVSSSTESSPAISVTELINIKRKIVKETKSPRHSWKDSSCENDLRAHNRFGMDITSSRYPEIAHGEEGSASNKQVIVGIGSKTKFNQMEKNSSGNIITTEVMAVKRHNRTSRRKRMQQEFIC